MNTDGLHHVTAGASPPAHFRHEEHARKLLSAVRDAGQRCGKATVNLGLAMLLASQHVEHLSPVETPVVVQIRWRW
jgi:hypothetical protein